MGIKGKKQGSCLVSRHRIVSCSALGRSEVYHAQAAGRSSLNAEENRHLFQGYPLCFREEEQHGEELEGRHRGKENERVDMRGFGKQRKYACYQGVRDPVSGASDTLPFGPDPVGKYFADVN